MLPWLPSSLWNAVEKTGVAAAVISGYLANQLYTPLLSTPVQSCHVSSAVTKHPATAATLGQSEAAPATGKRSCITARTTHPHQPRSAPVIFPWLPWLPISCLNAGAEWCCCSCIGGSCPADPAELNCDDMLCCIDAVSGRPRELPYWPWLIALMEGASLEYTRLWLADEANAPRVEAALKAPRPMEGVEEGSRVVVLFSRAWARPARTVRVRV